MYLTQILNLFYFQHLSFKLLEQFFSFLISIRIFLISFKLFLEELLNLHFIKYQFHILTFNFQIFFHSSILFSIVLKDFFLHQDPFKFLIR